MSEDLGKSSSGPPDNLFVPHGLGTYDSEMTSTGEDSMAHVQEQRETKSPEDIRFPTEASLPRLELLLKEIEMWNVPMTTMRSRFAEIWKLFGGENYSTYARNEVEHLDHPVPVVEKKNGYKWNMTEDEYDLWVSLDEETANILIQKCPEKAEDVRGLRSEARKGKAIALLPSSVAPGQSTSSPGRGNGNQYQTSRDCGGLVDKQKFDPDGPPVCSAAPNQTGNAAATFCIEDGKRLVPTDNGPKPEHIRLVYPDQFHTQQVDPAKRSVNSARPNKIGDGAATFCLEFGGGADPPHPPPPDQTLLGGDSHSVHNQQVDPVNGSVNLAPPNQTGNFAGIGAGADLSIAENNEPPNDKYSLENTFMVGSQMISTMGAVSANKSTSEMSSNAQMLWYFLVGCIFVGLIFWFYALWVFGNKQRRKAARFVMVIAYIATAFALLAVTGLQLPDEVMTWGTLGACILSLPAIIGYAMK